MFCSRSFEGPKSGPLVGRNLCTVRTCLYGRDSCNHVSVLRQKNGLKTRSVNLTRGAETCCCTCRHQTRTRTRPTTHTSSLGKSVEITAVAVRSHLRRVLKIGKMCLHKKKRIRITKHKKYKRKKLTTRTTNGGVGEEESGRAEWSNTTNEKKHIHTQ